MRCQLAFSLALLCSACGGSQAPTVATGAHAGASSGADPGHSAPNPDLANPCDSAAIDPTINPCLGAAGEAAAKEEAAKKTETVERK